MALTKISNQSLSSITSLPATIPAGALTLISTQTASSSTSISFTSGIDSTYDSYIFKFINMHPATDNVEFRFNSSTDSGSNYNVTKTTTHFISQHNESDSEATLEYRAAGDLAQSTSDQTLTVGVGNDNDQCVSGTLHIFNPASTTFVKHFIASVNVYQASNYSVNSFVAGYFNTTSAVNAIKFIMSSGNIDSGTIKLYGIKDS